MHVRIPADDTRKSLTYGSSFGVTFLCDVRFRFRSPTIGHLRPFVPFVFPHVRFVFRSRQAIERDTFNRRYLPHSPSSLYSLDLRYRLESECTC